MSASGEEHLDWPVSSPSSSTRALGQFPAPIIQLPSSPHTSTIIFLHGRGMTAAKFAEPLLSTQIAHRGTLRDALPHTKFVFPTAPLMRATKYRRAIIHQWYDGTGDWEPDARGDMRDSVRYVHGLLRQETQLLGSSQRVVLAGFSQGCAMSLVSMLLWDGPPLGAVIGVSGFMPLNAHLTEMLSGREDDATHEDDGVVFEVDKESDGSGDAGDGSEPRSALQRAIDELREEVELDVASLEPSPLSFQSTPAFIGHGTEDESVECRHGELAARLLGLMGVDVELHLYQGLGHWYSAEMLQQMIDFLVHKAGVDCIRNGV